MLSQAIVGLSEVPEHFAALVPIPLYHFPLTRTNFNTNVAFAHPSKKDFPPAPPTRLGP